MQTEKGEKMKENIENKENTVEYIDSLGETPIVLDKEYYMENRDIVQYSTLYLNKLDDGEVVVTAVRYHEGFPSQEEVERYIPYWEAVHQAYGKRVMPVFISGAGVEEE